MKALKDAWLDYFIRLYLSSDTQLLCFFTNYDYNRETRNQWAPFQVPLWKPKQGADVLDKWQKKMKKQIVFNFRASFNQTNKLNTGCTDCTRLQCIHRQATWQRHPLCLHCSPMRDSKMCSPWAQVFVYIVRNNTLSQTRGLCGPDKDRGYLLHSVEPFRWIVW